MPLPAPMRLFLAVPLPADVQASIRQSTATLRKSAPSIHWIRAEGLHVTVKFLGERPDAEVSAIVAATRDVVTTTAPLDLVIGGGGAFPNFHAPRVVWLGMRNAHPLVFLAGAIDACLAPLGIAPERRPFHPHVTVGRVRAPLPRDEGARLAGALWAQGGQWPLRVTHLELMHSTRSAEGSAYVPVGTMNLEGA